MKKLLLIPLLGLLLASCIDNAPDGENQFGGNEEPVDNKFLTVSIVSAGKGTRASYKDGSDDENKVEKVRFYFFDADGGPAAVKYDAGAYKSYYDWSPAATQQTKPADGAGNIEKVLEATVIINLKEKDEVPDAIVAVLNPSDMGTENLSLDKLNEVIKDYNTAALTESGRFVMSNSVYLDGSGAGVEAIPVTEDYIFDTQDKAQAHPVQICVERVVARLDLKVAMTALNGKPNVYETGDTVYEIEDLDDETENYKGKIYVKFLGWNVTAAADRSWLMKRVNEGWSPTLFANGEPWNDSGRYRSFWAINPEEVQFRYGNFGQAPDGTEYTPRGDNAANANTDFTGATPVYMQENAAVYGGSGMQEPADNTKVIIAAQLVRTDGETPVPLAEWGFKYYTPEALKTLWADNLKVYKKSVQNGSDTYTKITADDIVLVTAGSLAENKSLVATDSQGRAPQAKGRYYVYPQLVNSKGAVWSFSDAADAEEAGYEAANAAVQLMGPAKVWNNGYTYYYFDIAHLGAVGNPGAYGVVRNHIYAAEIRSLTGLGTPVYDPSETIYPEKPTGENNMIAAEVNILTWRIVQKTFKLDW